MADYLRVQGGVAVEVWTAPQDRTPTQCFTPQVAATFKPRAGAQIGWVWDGTQFSPPAPPAAAPVVPASVTRAQAKLQLHRAGLLDAVKTAVAADPEVQIWFDEASLWYRDNPHVIALGEAIAGGAPGIDALFIAASQITA